MALMSTQTNCRHVFWSLDISGLSISHTSPKDGLLNLEQPFAI